LTFISNKFSNFQKQFNKNTLITSIKHRSL